MIFTRVFYVNLQEFVLIFDDIVILIEPNHINNSNDGSKKKIIFLDIKINKNLLENYLNHQALNELYDIDVQIQLVHDEHQHPNSNQMTRHFHL